jgi:enoyl-CoA hydratase
MPDPLTEDGRANPAYGPGFMNAARVLGRAVWKVFGPQVSPDFVVDRPDQSTLHLSTFLVRDYDESDELPCGWVILKGNSNLSILGSHMYRSGQAHEVIRLLAEGRIVMEQGDLEITTLEGLPQLQQAMLDGRMTKPKGVALVQATHTNRPITEYEQAYLGEPLRLANEREGRYLAINWCDGVALVTLERSTALNALNEELLAQIEAVIDEVAGTGALDRHAVRALLLRGTGRAFMAGADITKLVGASCETIAALAAKVIAVYGRLERLPVPVVALIDGFALGGGNELAMSAHYRIVTENALMGQPEIKLGIMPGYGGMQRLPRLVGPRKALELVLNGEPVDGHRAVEIGLADVFCAAATALREAFRVAREMAEGLRPIPRRSWETIPAVHKKELDELLASTEVTGLLNTAAPDLTTARDLITARSYAARVALEALQMGYKKGFAEGLNNDARLFGQVTSSPSGQHWAGRFLEKDPLQSAILTLLTPR